MRKLMLAGLAMLTAASAATATAQRNYVIVTGSLTVAPSMMPIPELSQLGFTSFYATFLINSQPTAFTAAGPSAGQGASGFWGGAISEGFVAIFSPAGTISFVQNASDPGNLFLINDGGVAGNANQRRDQIGISSTVTSFGPAGPVLPYDASNSVGFAGLPSDVFLGALTFARTDQTTLPALPGLINDLSAPDFTAILQQPGSPPFLSLRFRRGTASNQTELLALPAQSLTSTGLTYSIVAAPNGVPEPASWLMLILGFGATGTVLRRRAAARAMPG